MNELDKIEAFVRKHHVMTLATVSSDGKPWTAHVFYAWMPTKKSVSSGQNEPKSGSGRIDEQNKPGNVENEHTGAGCFVFMCNPGTRHGAEMEANANVAAAIALETRVVGRLQGLQIEGVVRRAEGNAERNAKSDEAEDNAERDVKRNAGSGDAGNARRAYLRRFPYAVAIEAQLWILEPTLMKFTDNTLGFGKKLIWEKR